MTEPRAPERKDYADVLDWARDFEAYVKREQAASPVKVLQWGLIALRVCAPGTMNPAAVEAEVARIMPTGIRSRWAIVTAADVPNPVVCAEDEIRRHWLLAC